MMPSTMEVYILIFCLSIVQSLFGVGLLLFGTPILLAMGYEYTQALMILLPASAAISWSQVAENQSIQLNGGYRKLFFMICMPMLFIGMWLASSYDLKWEIKLGVTVMLVVAFFIRTSPRFLEKMKAWMKRNLKQALFTMGLIHGLSNMGGSILTPLVSSLYDEKKKVLAGVSFDYAFMATFQLIILIGFKGETFEAKYLLGPAISLSVRYLIGKSLFLATSEKRYQHLLNGFIIANAILLAINL